MTLHSYENIIGCDIKSAERKANKILLEGWKLGRYPLINIARDIPWEYASSDTRSWNFHIHCLDMIDPLLKSFEISKSIKYLDGAVTVVRKWIDYVKFANEDSLSPFVWYDMAVGVRSYRLGYLYQVLDKLNLEHELRNDLSIYLIKHAHYLIDEKNIIFHNNHGLYQVAGMLALSRRMKDLDSFYNELEDKGQEYFIKMLAQQFSDDGIHKEHSPDYHRMVYETVNTLLECKLVQDPALYNKCIEIENALSWFIFPDGKIVNFGDSDLKSFFLENGQFSDRWITESIVSYLDKGKYEPLTMKLFDKGGYAVVRGHPSDNSLSDKSYLSQIACFHSRAHKHADDLSFVWFENGSHILVDSGRFGYIGKTEMGSVLWNDGFWYADPNRLYCESTRAHNTLEFDGLSYPRKGVKPYGSALARSLVTDNNVFVIETECKHFKSIRRVRVLFYRPGEWLLIYDWYKDNLDLVHDCTQWFHFHPEINVTNIDGERFAFSNIKNNDESGIVLNLISDSSLAHLIKGKVDEPKQGWFSPVEGVMQENFALGFEKKSSVQNSFATLINLDSSCRLSSITSRVNVSGRKGCFNWSTSNSQHTLEFERPKSGSLLIDYKLENIS